ncbi:S1C family serine protease [Microbacterium aurantiacum]|uniref:Trypsin-like peptidase domain-containing protein n=2 Tax=Microbacterium aurantiacum TaxID=162393 RepID=A0AAJ2HIU1_9MICO|nr:trypsin-like peptidase domain-containing protein [Microbacterium aurantiacum]MDS0246427.1 trypsin-like peptidase domain-containing protein [Microbacterium aurantiacum]
MNDPQDAEPIDRPTDPTSATEGITNPAVPPRPPLPPQTGYAPPQGYVLPGAVPPHASGAATPTGPAATIPMDFAATAAPAPAPAPRRTSAGAVVGLLVAAAVVGGAAGLGGAYAGVNLFSTSASAPASGPVSVTVNDTDSVTEATGIAARTLPSVVTISASGTNGSGSGSGVILSADGYVVTNTHVVTLDGASADASIRATTSDGQVFDAEIVGTDPTYDLAVIKLDGAADLTPIEFASSADLNVGDTTAAVGAPLGLSNTVTTGIVSALNRSIAIASAAAPETPDAEDGEQQGEGDAPFYFDFGQGRTTPGSGETISIAVIQTDAAINPGNSGGALVDSEGRLIGINVAIASAGGSSGQAGSIGVGFAIPSDIVQRIAEEIIDTGAATHGLLGANVRSAASVEGSQITGAYIQEAVAGGAAEAAGLRQGDIVTAFNGVPISNATDLTAQVRAAAAGSTATVTYVRGDATEQVDVTLGTLGG